MNLVSIGSDSIFYATEASLQLNHVHIVITNNLSINVVERLVQQIEVGLWFLLGQC